MNLGVTVYVLTYEVPHEFGYPLGVYSTAELAEAAKVRAAEPYRTEYTDASGFERTLLGKRDPNDLQIYAFGIDAAPVDERPVET